MLFKLTDDKSMYCFPTFFKFFFNFPCFDVYWTFSAPQTGPQANHVPVINAFIVLYYIVFFCNVLYWYYSFIGRAGLRSNWA